MLLAINCTEPPVRITSDLTEHMTWKEVEGNPRPYATLVEYSCTREGWGYAASGLSTTISACQNDSTWNVTYVPACVSKLISAYQ